MKLPQVAVPSLPYRGHPHFARRLLNRRRFLEKTGLTVGALAASGLLTGAASAASTANRGRHSTTTAAPQPIPGGLQLLGPDGPLFHVFLPAPGVEPSTITDVEDYHDVVNALMDGPEVDAEVSWNIRWSHPLGRTKIRDVENNFAGDFVQNVAQLAWTGKTDAATFVSDPEETSVNEFSLLAHERNGVFFS